MVATGSQHTAWVQHPRPGTQGLSGIFPLKQDCVTSRALIKSNANPAEVQLLRPWLGFIPSPSIMAACPIAISLNP